MNWIKHLELEGKHAFLSPSGYSWLNYTDDKLRSVYTNRQNVERGTELHRIASDLINYKLYLKGNSTTMAMFVNDCIREGMTSEQVLYYSPFCFGTADGIKFEKGILSVYDLKTGDTKAKFDQLDIYCALFCLEYKVDPFKIDFIERIYQHDETFQSEPSSEMIDDIMRKIVEFDKILQNFQSYNSRD